MKNWTALFLVCLLLVDNQNTFSANNPVPEKHVEMRWSELGPFLAGSDLLGRGETTLALSDGSIVQGQIAEVRKDDLVVMVSKSSDSQAHPKGRQSISRRSVSTIRLRQIKGATGRIIGTLGGIFGGGSS